MKGRALLGVMLVMSMLLAALPLVTVKSQATTVEILFENGGHEITESPCSNFIVTVRISLDPGEQIDFAVGEIHWDPNVLELQTGTTDDVVEGPWMKSFGITVFAVMPPDNVNGILPEIACGFITAVKATGSGDFCYINFHCKAPGDGNITIFDPYPPGVETYLLDGINLVPIDVVINGVVHQPWPEPTPPNAEFTPPDGAMVDLCTNITLDASGSYPGQDTAPFIHLCQIVEYKWEIDDDGVPGVDLTLYGEIAYYHCKAPGIVTITLTINSTDQFPPGVFFWADGWETDSETHMIIQLYPPCSTSPDPYITHPLNCSLIYDNMIEVSAIDMNNQSNTVQTTFKYAQSTAGPWTLIAQDSNSTDGWRTLWDLTGFSEGDYYISATMINDQWQGAIDIAHIYYDPKPPNPEFTVVTFPQVVSGTIDLTATTLGDNITNAEFWIYSESWTHCLWFNKTIPKLDQHKINATNDPEEEGLVNWNDGNWSCGPTATASCLAYWDAYVDPNGQRPYKDLYDETQGDNDGDGYPDGLEEMAREIYKRAQTNQRDRDGKPGPDKGTWADDLRDGINAYIKNKGLDKKLEAKAYGSATSTMELLIKEFLRCQDVIVLFACPGDDEKLGTADDYGHYVTISSIHFKLLYINIIGPFPIPIIIGIDLDFMDPWTGETGVGEVDLANNQVKSDWNGNGSTGVNEFAKLFNMVTVCPKSPEWIYIGEDSDGSDGWSIPWDTTQLPDAYYLVKATMTDTIGHNGTDIMLVYINNARITDITPAKPVVGKGYSTDIEVSVENLFVESAFFNITLYCNETLLGTKNVTLASQASTTIKFTWNTTGIPNGNYTIIAETSALLNETYPARLTYMDGWIFVARVGDLGGGLPPHFFKCDGIVDGKDFALFLQCFKGIAPPEAMYLGDLGGDLPPKFYQCDGVIDGKDLALFLQCFKGLGPPDP